MPEAVSEEELQQLREKNEQLREDIESARREKAENEAARQREFEALELMQENARLEAELKSAEAAAAPEVSEAGSANVIDAAKEQLLSALQKSEVPAGVPVDTNAENQPEGTTGMTFAVDTEAEGEKSEDTSDAPLTPPTTPPSTGSSLFTPLTPPTPPGTVSGDDTSENGGN